MSSPWIRTAALLAVKGHDVRASTKDGLGHTVTFVPWERERWITATVIFNPKDKDWRYEVWRAGKLVTAGSSPKEASARAAVMRTVRARTP